MRPAPSALLLLAAAASASADDRVLPPRARRVVQIAGDLGDDARIVAAGVDATGGVSVLLDATGDGAFAWRRFAADGTPTFVADDVALPAALGGARIDESGSLFAVASGPSLVRMTQDGDVAPPLELDPAPPDGWSAVTADIAVRDGFVHAVVTRSRTPYERSVAWRGVAADGTPVGPAVDVTPSSLALDRPPRNDERRPLIYGVHVETGAEGDCRVVFQSLSVQFAGEDDGPRRLEQNFVRIDPTGRVVDRHTGYVEPRCQNTYLPADWNAWTSAALRSDGTMVATTAARFRAPYGDSFGPSAALSTTAFGAPTVWTNAGAPRAAALDRLLAQPSALLAADARNHVFLSFDYDGEARARGCSPYDAVRPASMHSLSRLDPDGSVRSVRLSAADAAGVGPYVSPVGDVLFTSRRALRDGRAAPSLLWISPDLKRIRRLAFTPAFDVTTPYVFSSPAAPTRFAAVWIARASPGAPRRAYLAVFE